MVDILDSQPQWISMNSSNICGTSFLYSSWFSATTFAARHLSVRYCNGLILQSGRFFKRSMGRSNWEFLESMWAPLISNISTTWKENNLRFIISFFSFLNKEMAFQLKKSHSFQKTQRVRNKNLRLTLLWANKCKLSGKNNSYLVNKIATSTSRV